MIMMAARTPRYITGEEAEEPLEEPLEEPAKSGGKWREEVEDGRDGVNVNQARSRQTTKLIQ